MSDRSPVPARQILWRVLAGLLLLWAAPALGHKVNLFAFAEGERVYVQGYFSDGKRPQGGKVEVFGPGGELLLQGRTDQEGEFTFPTPAVSPIEVVLEAEMGHTARMRLDLAEEVGGGGAGGQATAEGAGEADSPQEVRRLERLIERAVTKAVLPLAREVDALKSRVSTDRLLAGLGVILACLGGVAYLQARRLRAEAERLRAAASNKKA